MFTGSVRVKRGFCSLLRLNRYRLVRIVMWQRHSELTMENNSDKSRPDLSPTRLFE